MSLEEINLSPKIGPKNENQYTNPAFIEDLYAEPKNGVETKKTKLEFDDLLPYLGEFGLYQKILFLMMIPFAFFLAWVYFTQIFITLTPEEHWCWIPELENLTAAERLTLAIPKTPSGKSEKCKMYDANYTPLRNFSSTPVISCRSGWEFNNSEIPYKSVAAELNWVCENSALASTAQSIFFCGSILGGLVFGWVSDKYGRVAALVGTNMIGFVGGVATAFCDSFWSFCICRFLIGMAYDNCFTMMYILVLEYVGPKWRTFVANMSIAVFFTFASTTLPWIAYYLADWRMLCLVTSVPLVSSIVTPWVVPESARWLVSQGKIDKAMKIIRKIQKVNKKEIDEEVYDNFKRSCYDIMMEEANSKSYTVLDLFKTPRLRRITVLLILMWMCISLVFDGHVRNVGSLGLDVFLTFSIGCFTEFPADVLLVLFMDSWGRRWFAFGTMVASGLFSLLATAVPHGAPSAALALSGRFAVNISFNIGLQYAAELLPTVVRGQGVALIHIMGYVATIVSPFIVYLARFSTDIPLFILGFLGIFGGILSLFLPESIDHELPQTLLDGENFGRGQKFWYFPCLKNRNRRSS